jgi:hypothetical protein
MSGAIPALPQYPFMAWCTVKAQGHLYLYLIRNIGLVRHKMAYAVGTTLSNNTT